MSVVPGVLSCIKDAIINVRVELRLPFRNMFSISLSYFFYFIQTNATATLKKFVPHCCSVIEHLTSGKLLNSTRVDILSRGLCYSLSLNCPLHMKRN